MRVGVESRAADGEIIAADLNSRRYLGINESGAYLWPLLQTGATTESLVARLCEVYGITPAAAKIDVEQWLVVLAERDLLSS